MQKILIKFQSIMNSSDDFTQNLPGKLGQQSVICWNFLGLFREYGLNYIFYRIFFHDRKLKLSATEKEFSETSQNFDLFSSFRLSPFIFRDLFFNCKFTNLENGFNSLDFTDCCCLPCIASSRIGR